VARVLWWAACQRSGSWPQAALRDDAGIACRQARLAERPDPRGRTRRRGIYLPRRPGSHRRRHPHRLLDGSTRRVITTAETAATPVPDVRHAHAPALDRAHPGVDVEGWIDPGTPPPAPVRSAAVADRLTYPEARSVTWAARAVGPTPGACTVARRAPCTEPRGEWIRAGTPRMTAAWSASISLSIDSRLPRAAPYSAEAMAWVQLPGLRGEPSGWVSVAVRPVSRMSRPRSSSAAPS
jgi:hypothetical protein